MVDADDDESSNKQRKWIKIDWGHIFWTGHNSWKTSFYFFIFFENDMFAISLHSFLSTEIWLTHNSHFQVAKIFVNFIDTVFRYPINLRCWVAPAKKSTHKLWALSEISLLTLLKGSANCFKSKLLYVHWYSTDTSAVFTIMVSPPHNKPIEVLNDWFIYNIHKIQLNQL